MDVLLRPANLNTAVHDYNTLYWCCYIHIVMYTFMSSMYMYRT